MFSTKRILILALMVPLSIGGSGWAQQTDPLGNPIKKPKGGEKSTLENKSSKPTTGSHGKPESGQDNPPNPPARSTGTLPDATGRFNREMDENGLSLRDYVPETRERKQLPTERDFQAEESGTAMSQRTLPNPTANQESESQDVAIQTRSAEGKPELAEHGQFKLIKRSTRRWKFGLEITASGNLGGAVATAPLPIAWEEQNLRIVRSFQSPAVNKVTIKKFPGQGHQMIVSVPRLPSGSKAEAWVIMELDRFDIVEPTSPETLLLPEKGNRSARKYMGESPYIETNDKRITQLAQSIVNPDDSPWNQALSIYDWVQQNIEYRFDPQIHSCLEALDAKRGDCEEVASLFIALCRNRGIPARAVWCNDHTYPEFMLCTPDGKDVWFPCQITTTEHMFGVMYDDRPILQKGDKFSILGELKPHRYLKPAMTAKQANGSPLFRWIIEEVNPEEQVAPADSPLGNTGR